MTLYNPNVPTNLDDSYADTQPQLLNNFMTLFNTFIRNHIDINGTNAGLHNKVDLYEQPHAFQTGVGELSVYCKNVDGQTDQIFLRYQGDGQEVQMTNYQIYSVLPTATQTSYFTFLPGKVIVYFGTTLAVGVNKINLTPAIAKNIITVQITDMGTAGGIVPPIALNVVNAITTSITLNSNFNIAKQSYLVIANI